MIVCFFAPQAAISATKRLAIENFSLPSNSKLTSDIVTEDFKQVVEKDPGEYRIEPDLNIADFVLKASMMEEENGQFTVQAIIYKNVSLSKEFAVKQSGDNRNQALRRLWLAVRSYPNSIIIGGRYQDNGDGTVTDITTNLTWKRCSEGQTWTGNACIGDYRRMSLDEAMPNGAQKSWPSFAGNSDWRVPSKTELQTIVWCSNGTPSEEAWTESCVGIDNRNGSYQQPTLDSIAFTGSPSTVFWSSSVKDDNSSYFWAVDFTDGNSAYYVPRAAGNLAVRLLR